MAKNARVILCSEAYYKIPPRNHSWLTG